MSSFLYSNLSKYRIACKGKQRNQRKLSKVATPNPSSLHTTAFCRKPSHTIFIICSLPNLFVCRQRTKVTPAQGQLHSFSLHFLTTLHCPLKGLLLLPIQSGPTFSTTFCLRCAFSYPEFNGGGCRVEKKTKIKSFTPFQKEMRDFSLMKMELVRQGIYWQPGRVVKNI